MDLLWCEDGYLSMEQVLNSNTRDVFTGGGCNLISSF